MLSGITAANADSAPANTFNVNESTVKILGRSFMQDDYTCFSYGSSGIAVNFTGTDFYIDVAQLDGANASTDIMVLVDTLMPMEATKYTVTANTGWLKVASNLKNGEHFIRIMKMSRGIGAGGWFGTDWFGIRAIGVNGGSVLIPDPKSDLIIEAYGDSITNGDAVWKNADGSSSAYTWGAYSGVVARLLDADVYSTGNTGNGLNSWCLGAGNLFPPRESWTQYDPRASQNQEVDHSETDVVIINLGTNDMAAINSTAEDCAEYTEEAFKQSYISWMQEVRQQAPNAIVIAALGAMGADKLFDDIEAAVNQVNAEAGKTYAYWLQLAKCNSISGGMGYDNAHPSNAAHEIYGAQMAAIITEALGLDNVIPESGEANLALKATAIDSSTAGGNYSYYGDFKASNLNDGDSSTGWQYGNDRCNNGALTDCWAGLDFGTVTKFNKVIIDWESGTKCTESGFEIQYSNDGKAWTAVKNPVLSYGNTSTVTFDEVTARYVRVNMTQCSSSKYAPKVYEIQVYGPKAVDKTVNLALTSTAIDSGAECYSANNSADKAIDGDANTGWQYKKSLADLGDVWLGIKLSSASLLEKAVISWETETRATEYTVEYSYDGEAWYNVTGASYAKGSDNGGTTTDTVTFDGVTAQYLRVSCTASNNAKFSPKVWELEIYA